MSNRETQGGLRRRAVLAGMAGAGASLGAGAGLLAGSGIARAQQAGGYPSKQLDWIIAFGPGGGNDIMSRTLIDILQKHQLYPNDIVAENRVGGSGAVGWGHLFNQRGNPYFISSTSGSFITTPLQANTPWKPTSFTPIALLATDDLVLLVNGSSEIKTLEEFIARAKEQPPNIGGIGSVNVDFIIPSLLSKQAGFEFQYVPFNAAGELTTGLLSNALDAIMANPGEILGLMDSGDMRGLAFTGRATPAALGDIPTLQSAGYDIDISQPRGLVLPPDAPEEAQAWWIETVRKVAETPEWQSYIEKNLLTENVRFGNDFRDFLAATSATFEEILKGTGAIQ